MTRATVLSHGRPQQTEAALRTLIAVAKRCGVALRFDAEETRKHGLSPADGIECGVEIADEVDLCVVLGGDGTILRGLRRYASTGVPVFAVNFGEVGFLATVDPDEIDGAFERAFAGDFDVLTLPALALELPDGAAAAINDVSLHRKAGMRVARLAYELEGVEVGSVRCDGIVVATPAGSTGYNLANGGPVLAWGVEGYVVSFIAPHSLTARTLVVAPGDRLTIHNRSYDAVDLSIDGLTSGEVATGEAISAHFVTQATRLAQISGSSFYGRLREKFGLLA
jgi:NAD+ kinase